MSEGEAMEERLESEQDVTFDDYLKDRIQDRQQSLRQQQNRSCNFGRF